jgi:hypothetical protein
MIQNPAPTPQQIVQINALKGEFVAVERVLLDLPGNRERALALTNLEQASMWATKAILEGQVVTAERARL